MTTHRSVVRTGGFSLVEVLVAMAIGMIASILILQIYSASEQRKRTTTGGADAQTNGMVALYLIERDLRQAGYGLSPNLEDFVDASGTAPLTTPPPPTATLGRGILAQCANVLAYNSGRAPAGFSYSNSTFAPVAINPKDAAGLSIFPAGDNGSDVILVNYGGSRGVVGSGADIVDFGSTVQPGGMLSDFQATSSRAGLNQGDLFIAVPPAGATSCHIGEITALPASGTATQCPTTIAGTPDLISHNNVSYENYYHGCLSVPATRNDPAGVSATYGVGSKLYSLGPVGSFVSRVYAIRHCATAGCSLAACDLTASDCSDAANVSNTAVWRPIAAGIVGLRAEYGKDPDGSTRIETWDAAQPTGASWAHVLAVRIAVVARSGQYEKTDLKTGDVTRAAPVWEADAAGTSATSVGVSAVDTANWSHYRYKVAQSVVPLRNMLWGQQQP